MPTVASYCTTFLKPEMMHIYRQITGLRGFDTFVIAKERQCAERFPFDDVELQPKVRSNFVRRFWLKYVKREPPIVYRGEYGDDFSKFAELCGAKGIRVTEDDQLDAALAEALSHDGPSCVEIMADAKLI